MTLAGGSFAPIGRSFALVVAGWAIAAGYLGLVSVLCVPAPLALLAGILAVREMKRDPKKHGMGRAVFGIVMGSQSDLDVMRHAAETLESLALPYEMRIISAHRRPERPVQGRYCSLQPR